MEVVFSFNQSYAGSAYLAKNTAAKGLLDALIASLPDGWTLDDSQLPEPTSSSLTYYATFIMPEGYKIKISVSPSSSSATQSFTIDLIGSTDAVIVRNATSSAFQITYNTSSSMAMAIGQIKRFFKDSQYDVYAFGATFAYYPIGAFKLKNKIPLAPDWIICSNGANFFSIDGASSYFMPTSSYFYYGDSLYCIYEVPIKLDATSSAYLGTLTGVYTPGSAFGSDTALKHFSIDGVHYVLWNCIFIPYDE